MAEQYLLEKNNELQMLLDEYKELQEKQILKINLLVTSAIQEQFMIYNHGINMFENNEIDMSKNFDDHNDINGVFYRFFKQASNKYNKIHITNKSIISTVQIETIMWASLFNINNFFIL